MIYTVFPCSFSNEEKGIANISCTNYTDEIQYINSNNNIINIFESESLINITNNINFELSNKAKLTITITIIRSKLSKWSSIKDKRENLEEINDVKNNNNSNNNASNSPSSSTTKGYNNILNEDNNTNNINASVSSEEKEQVINTVNLTEKEKIIQIQWIPVINEDHQIYKINSNTEFSIIPDNDTVEKEKKFEDINKKKIKDVIKDEQPLVVEIKDEDDIQ
ncbi:hypothetical protein U3516DRAFT_737448 [Neocallimastix sp. 'constans']